MPLSSKVRARVPEKQGLKQIDDLLTEYQRLVRARVPEKQGLKLADIGPLGGGLHCPGASSRKTRIETVTGAFPRLLGAKSGREFQKNKD